MTALVNTTTISTSAVLPATYDATGYNALTFTAIANVLDIGELAKAYNIVAHQTIDNRYPEKLKGNYDIANVTLTLGRVIGDAGQVLLQAALAADTSYSFKIALPSGNAGQFTAKVIKAGTGAIAADGVETTVAELAIDPQTLVEA